MNLPVVEVTVQALRGSRVCGKTPSSEKQQGNPDKDYRKLWQDAIMHKYDMHHKYPKDTPSLSKLRLTHQFDNIVLT